jgi:hypothetical protein
MSNGCRECASLFVLRWQMQKSWCFSKCLRCNGSDLGPFRRRDNVSWSQHDSKNGYLTMRLTKHMSTMSGYDHRLSQDRGPATPRKPSDLNGCPSDNVAGFHECSRRKFASQYLTSCKKSDWKIERKPKWRCRKRHAWTRDATITITRHWRHLH